MNTSFWNPERIRSTLEAEWLAPPPDARDAEGIALDSRELKPGQAFLAMKGEATDGHRFLRAAADAGARFAILDDPAAITPDLAPRMGLLRVRDTARALQRLAAAHRDRLTNARVVAITGSNGKTTTTRLIESILSRSMAGTASRKSFNNHIGVPLTLLAARPDDHYLLGEVGMNHPGEIEPLARLVRPDLAVITSIGRAHLEGLGSLDAIAREKASLLHHLRPDGAAFVTADSAPLDAILKGRPGIVRVGESPDADLRVTDIRPEPAGTSFILAGVARFVGLIGRHNALNAALAASVARRLGVPDHDIDQGLRHPRAAPMRLEERPIGPLVVINDAYNANPDSMLAALRTLADRPPGPRAGRRVIVLGDMLEIGNRSEAVHREIGHAGAAVAQLAVFVGPAMRHAARAFLEARPGGQAEILDDAGPAAAAKAAALLEPGDLVLIKGSRRMGLERVADAIASRWADPFPSQG